MTTTSGGSTAGRRLAALGALVCLTGAISVFALGAVANWRSVVVAVAAVLQAVLAGWYAASQRGTARRVAATLGGAGIALAFAAVVGADLVWSHVAVAVALAACSVGLARVALRRSPRTIRREVSRLAPAAPARRPVLIINPRSGGARAERHQLIEACWARGIEALILQPGDDLLQTAEDAIAQGADVIGMAGGDGSQALVATAAVRHDVPHVVVPAGTRNHLALDLGLDRNDVIGALDAFVDGVERRIDVAKVNGLLFLNNASVGVYARIVQSPEYRDAKLQTVLDMLPDLVGPDAPPVDLHFVDADGERHAAADVVIVSNNPYQLHKMVGRGTRDRLDRGVLGIVTGRISTARDFTRFFALETTGRGQRFPGLLEWTAGEFRIDSAAPLEIGLDGEARVMDPPLVFESAPAALRVRLPRHALGRSPAALAPHVLARSTVGRLARLAIGQRGSSASNVDSEVEPWGPTP